MMQINSGQVAAAGRHVLSFIMGAIAFASATHYISADDASNLSAAVTNIATGLASLVAFATAAYAASTASDKNRIEAVAANPAVTSVVVKTPELANSVTSNKVVSQ